MKAAVAMISAFVLVVGLATMWSFAQNGTVASGAPSADAPTIQAFEKRVAEYLTLHKKVRDSAQNLSNSATPQQIDLVQKQMADRIKAARATAKPGDIFTPDIKEYILRVLSGVFSGPQGGQLRASILDENPIGTPVRVNAPYPDSIPISSTPPQVLEALPKLPPELEYRFVGSRLILFDHHAHLIVDYIDNALPRS